MTNIIKSKYKSSRALGVAIWGSEKDAYNKRNYRPGQHGKSARIKSSEFSLHLKEKQKLKSFYGRISERQFRNTFYKAEKMKGNTAVNFIKLLESRLDAVVYRMNIVNTIFAARQLVSHKHVLLNDKKVNIPSIQLKEGDVLKLQDQAKQTPAVAAAKKHESARAPEYLEFDKDKFTGTFIGNINSIDSVYYPFELDINRIVEYYSR